MLAIFYPQFFLIHINVDEFSEAAPLCWNSSEKRVMGRVTSEKKENKKIENMKNQVAYKRAEKGRVLKLRVKKEKMAQRCKGQKRVLSMVLCRCISYLTLFFSQGNVIEGKKERHTLRIVPGQMVLRKIIFSHAASQLRDAALFEI